MTDAISGVAGIGRMAVTCLVDEGHPDPAGVLVWVEQVMQSRLPDVCGRLLDRVLDPHDPAVWLIRGLEVDLAFDATRVDEHALEQAWARQLVGRVARTIAHGPDGVGVMCFPDRAAYIAALLGDLAEGSAWDQWYYEPFDSLRSLPPNLAIREALLREPEQSEAALISLASHGRLERILSIMTERDAQKVYQACAAHADAGAQPERELVEALLPVWLKRPFSILRDASAAHSALRGYIEARRLQPHLGAGLVRAGMDHLLTFAALLRASAAPAQILDCIATGRLHQAVSFTGQDAAAVNTLSFFQAAAAGDSAWLSQVALQLVEMNVPPPAAHAQTADAARSQNSMAPHTFFDTLFGGALLLLPVLIETGLNDVIEAVPYPDGEDLDCAAVLRHRVLTLCLGQPRLALARGDPAVALAAGLVELPSPDEIRRLSEQVTGEVYDVCLRRLLGRLVQQGTIDGRCLVAELVSLPAWPDVVLLRDVAADAWVYAASLSGDALDGAAMLRQGIALIRNQVGISEPPFLILDPALGTAPEALGSMGMVTALSAARMPDVFASRRLDLESVPAELREAVSHYLARARPAASELEYLADTSSELLPGVDSRSDLLWVLVARALLRSFAQRLIGFGWSSPEYLYQNFLSGVSSVDAGKDRVEVRLPPVPLNVVLHMAGIGEQTCSIPWWGGKPVTFRLAP